MESVGANQQVTVSMYVDYPSVKKVLLEEFEIPKWVNITVHKSQVDSVVQNYGSLCFLIQHGKTVGQFRLTEWHATKKEEIKRFLSMEFPLDHYRIQDTIFEPGNYTVSIDHGSVLLKHRVLSTYLIILDSIQYGYYSNTLDSALFHRYRDMVQLHTGLQLLDYSATVLWNNRIKLPITSINSAILDEENIRHFRTVYFYFFENEEDMGNRGYIFMEKLVFNNDVVQPVQVHLLNPIRMPNDSLVVLNPNYNHQKISDNLFFSFVNSYPKNAADDLLENNFVGFIYGVDNAGIAIKSTFWLKDLPCPDSVQRKLKSWHFGNGVKYFTYQSGDYLLYKNEMYVLNLNSGEITDFSEFIKTNILSSFETRFRRIIDLDVSDHVVRIVYTEKDSKSGILWSTINLEQRTHASGRLYHIGRIDDISISNSKVYLVGKNDDESVIHVKTYAID